MFSEILYSGTPIPIWVKKPNIKQVCSFPRAQSLPPDFGSKYGLVMKINVLIISDRVIAVIIRVYGEHFCDRTMKRMTKQDPRIDMTDDIVVNKIIVKACLSERGGIQNVRIE
jgi:hypothetical protein